jgi:hypothetical protein
LGDSASIFAVKVVGTPLIIAVATLAGRRWGPTVSGLIGGLPLASGPLTYFVTVEQGARFGAASATATMAGLVAVAAFAVVFCRLATLGTWPLPLSVGLLAFVGVAGVMVLVPMPPLVAFAAALLALSAGIKLVGSPQSIAEPRRAPVWGIPARAAVATAMVVGLSAAAAQLGPRLVGLIAPFPVYASVMGAFAHAHEGSAVAVRLIRGLLVGAYSFACFYLAVALLVTSDVPAAFATATLVALAVQAASIVAVRRLRW